MTTTRNDIRREHSPAPGSRSEVVFHAVLALVAFLCFAVLLAIVLWKADKLSALGLTGNLYYLVLVPLALSASAFLVSALRSHASYKGHQLGGTLELSGAVVVFFLVVILGFKLLPAPPTFPLTIFVHGPAGPEDLILRNFGHVLLDLGGDRRSELIGEKGLVHFSEIPSSFRGQPVNVSLEAAGYELVGPGQKLVLTGTSLYLEVRRKPGHIAGRVQDERGQPVIGASVGVLGISMTSTDAFGHFDLSIPGDQLKPNLPVSANAENFVQWNGEATPDSNEMVIPLRHRR